MSRKSILQDPGVKAALVALKTAIAAVNSDDEIVSLVTLAAVASGSDIYEVSFTASCSCPACARRIKTQFHAAMTSMTKGSRSGHSLQGKH